MSKGRLDQVIATFFPQFSRSKIRTLIEKGKVQINVDGWKTYTKPGLKMDFSGLSAQDILLSPDEELDHVSRGALKLKKAVEVMNLSVEGLTCLDVGLSTGGFSDFLLKNSAERVLGVDVGRDQLHKTLRGHPRLTYRDKVNAREPLPKDLLDGFFGEGEPQLFDLIVVDVSFISLDKIIPNIKNLLNPKGTLITLVKPQFELSRGDLNKQGVVKDEALLQVAVEKIIGVLSENKLIISNTCESPIEGDHGNKEFLLISRRH